MDIKVNPKTFFVFDLDDTLYKEIDFLKSAYRYISQELEKVLHVSLFNDMFTRYERRENAFTWILDSYGDRLPGWDMQRLLKSYREHIPEISLPADTGRFLEQVRDRGIRAGVITDGRSVTQRNKLIALGISDMFLAVVISEEFGSEKPDERNYRYFSDSYPDADFYYFGDNVIKDFITPRKLGWNSICLKDQGQNIHRQLPGHQNAADFVINGFDEIRLI